MKKTMTKSQKQFVKKQLIETGEISRNACLQNRITRLAAIVSNLKKEGMNIVGDTVRTSQGKDYVYYIKDWEKPKKRVVEIVGEGLERRAIIKYI